MVTSESGFFTLWGIYIYVKKYIVSNSCYHGGKTKSRSGVRVKEGGEC